MVVGFEDFAGEFGGGDDQGRDLAELEVEDRAKFAGEFEEGVVGHVGEEVEVADDWEPGRRGWEFASCRISEDVTEKEECYEEGDENREREGRVHGVLERERERDV